MRKDSGTQGQQLNYLSVCSGIEAASVAWEPLWIPCKDCEDWWCTVHHLHVFECECEDLDSFILNRNLDPYSGKTVHKEE